MIPTTTGNKTVNDPNFLKTIKDYTKKFNCEAAYFTEVNGNRNGFCLGFAKSRYDPDYCRTFISGIRCQRGNTSCNEFGRFEESDFKNIRIIKK
jgi:hypothetical protein